MIAHFDLTLPPSVNYIWKPVGSRMIRSKAYSAWLHTAGWEVMAARQAKIAGRYDLTIHLPVGMAGDLDNRAKGLSDLLEAQGVIENDRLCWSLVIHRIASIKPSRCSVFISPVSEARAA